jgi:transcription elongation factor Elf1
MSQESIDSSGICQNCFIKFNEYDEYITAANRIQKDLINLFEVNSYAIIDQEVEEGEKNLSVVKEEVDIDTTEYTYVESENIIEDDNTEEQVYFQEAEPPQVIMRQTVQYKKKTPNSSTKKKKSNSKVDKDAGLLFYFVDGVKLYECDICSKKDFQSRSRLKTHRLIHTNERNFICGTCDASFKTMNCLKNHMRLHNNIFYYCDLCPSKFKGKHELRCHIDAVHLLKKDFVCKICGKAFSRDKTLRQHMMYHINNRNVTCEICGYKTINRPKMTRHMKSHTGERNYSCPICGKKFLYSYNVSSHIRHVHNHEKRPTTNEEKLTCQICGQKFQKIWKVKDHMAEVHQIEQQEVVVTEEIESVISY